MPYSYHSLVDCLKAAGISSADAGEEALLLLEAFGGASRIACLCDRNRVYDTPALREAVEKRLTRYPLQYILGSWDFFGCRFAVNEHCLIPRPDTEVLVETAIKLIPENGVFIDLCTGSGCIAIAILVHRPDLRAVALELYPETLALAVKNAELNGVSPRFTPICADLLLEGREALAPLAPFCALVSNPPYIPKSVVDGLAPELFFEPRAALDGGEDGLVFYRRILADYASLLLPDAPLLLEIGYDQSEDLISLGKAYLPQVSCRILRDLGGQPRVAVFRNETMERSYNENECREGAVSNGK